MEEKEIKVDDGINVLGDLVETLDVVKDDAVANVGMNVLNDFKPFYEAVRSMIEGASSLLGSLVKTICEIKIPKIEIPVLDEETRKYFKFMELASTIGFPVFFEIDTELQDKVISLCGDYEKEHYPIEEIEQCIYEYYDHDMLIKMLETWYEQEWISFERKKALKEAVEVYGKGYYFSTGSVLMCQLGGLINELFDAADFSSIMPLEDRKNINTLYNVRKIDSEKAKVLQMMSIQDNGIFQWYKSADYMMNYTYSSTEDIARFEHDPGRHKICHGLQTNYGTREHALKAILVVDIVIQLGNQMFHNEEVNA